MSKDELDYSAFSEAPTNEALRVLHSLVTDLADAELLVAETEKKLKAAKKVADEISMHLLPEKMEELGMRQFTLRNGLTVDIKKEIYVSLPKKDPDRYEQGLAWLAEHGFEKSVKRKILAEFGKGRQAEADALVAKLNAAGFTADAIREIHPQTLKSIIKGWAEEGHEDEDAEKIFGIRRVDVAKIK